VLCIQKVGEFVELVPSGPPSGDEMENRMVKFSWMRESKDMVVDDR